MSPITVNARVEKVMRARKEPVRSWYFDLTPTMSYWGKERIYHHTPPITLIYGLREALRLALEEGLEERWERHLYNQQALIAGLEAMGLELFVSNPADRLVTVTGVNIPAGVEDGKVRKQLLDEFNIEISGGLGPVKGKIWRIGLMGYSCLKTNVLLFLAALEKSLLDQGYRLPAGAGVAAAIHDYQQTRSPPLRAEEIDAPWRRLQFTQRFRMSGSMSEFIGAFDVPSKVTDFVYQMPLFALLERNHHAPQPTRWIASFWSTAKE